jgi:hypothetical protein
MSKKRTVQSENILKSFDKELDKLMEFKMYDALPKEIKDILVDKIHEVRLLCQKYNLPPTIEDTIVTKFVYDLQSNIGYDLLLKEQYREE